MNKEQLFTVIRGLVELLYNLPGCAAGGCCHIITDDGNLDDNSIKFVIQWCNSIEHANRIDKDISLLLCKYLLRLTEDERFDALHYTNFSEQS